MQKSLNKGKQQSNLTKLGKNFGQLTDTNCLNLFLEQKGQEIRQRFQIIRNPIHLEHTPSSRQPILTFNRFQLLQDELHADDVEHDDMNDQDAGHAIYSSSFTGNKNKTGQTLGTAGTASGHSMHGDLLDNVSRGNKNKTGKSLGQSQSYAKQHSFQNVPLATSVKSSVHVPFSFKGNTNGNGSKLGHMHTSTEGTQHNLMLGDLNYDHQATHNPALIHFSGNKNGNGTKLGVQAVHEDTGETSIPRSTDIDVVHLSDPTVIDAQRFTCTCVRQIPSEVYADRFQSIDHKN